MASSWIHEEMKTVDLGDKRLDRRLEEVVSAFSDKPTASIPAACGGHAEMTAAYRFFDNEKVTFEKVLEPHIEATRKRMATQPVVILAQDTTEINLTRPQEKVEGAGPLDGRSRFGFFLHVLHAFTPDGTPLGTADAMAWNREDEIKCATLTRAERAAIPIEEKESYRWLTTFRAAREAAKACPDTQCICVADSEADIYELMAEAEVEPGLDWIVRACQDRALVLERPRKPGENTVRAQVLKTPVLYTEWIQVRGRDTKVTCEARGRRKPRRSRTAKVSVRAARVTLRPPSRPDRKLPSLTINVVLVREQRPPAGEEPAEWMLLTSLPIDEKKQVRLVVAYYKIRWMEEILFRVTKGGCRIEERRFKALDRLLPCLAVYLVAAWRTLYVCRLGRICPQTSCEVVFDPAEWKATWTVVRGEAPPRKPPPLEMMVRMVAQLGGYVNLPSSGPPGPQTVWIGMQRIQDFATCYVAFGPAAPHKGKDV